ncbi:MAG: iron-sulfur cluster repair di-iron protein [Opitutales bacterium]|nr:iron-sulfur cluster repair di-iron protein [Opitutales bacterium]
MSHTKTVFSPAGTPIAERTVGELVAEHPGLSRVFQAFDIGFCCQGGLTLKQACERKGVELDSVIQALESERAGRAGPESNPAELESTALIEYIVERHHGFLREELPRLHAMSQRVAHVHGGHTPSLVELFHVFTEMAEELVDHTQKEECGLFPAIKQKAQGSTEALPIEDPIQAMVNEHTATDQTLVRIRELTRNYEPPVEACNTYRALFAGLADLDADLQQHIHLENNVLFPWALKSA